MATSAPDVCILVHAVRAPFRNDDAFAHTGRLLWAYRRECSIPVLIGRLYKLTE